MDRIKGLRQKNQNTYNPLVPFGTDGILVDMASGLNNEEELKLGGNHNVSITEANGITTITETYLDQADPKQVKYTVKTEISENNNGTTIITSLWEGAAEGSASKIKITTIPEQGDIMEVLE